MAERPQPDRWRCLQRGCNPVLDAETAKEHTQQTAHRTAKWPVRSAAGQRAASRRNRSGYYDQYNVGAKAASVRLGRGRTRDPDDFDTDPEGWDGHKDYRGV